MLLRSNRDGRMSVITALRMAVARAFPIVLSERFLTTHSEVGKRYDRHGSSWKYTLRNIQDVSSPGRFIIFNAKLCGEGTESATSAWLAATFFYKIFVWWTFEAIKPITFMYR